MMNPLSRIISSFSMYKFLQELTTPFTKLPAYRTGVINEHGIQIVPNNELSPEQNNSFNDFDRLVISLKRLIALVPDPYVRSYMSSPVTAAHLMSEECRKMGGDPQYFMQLMARELLACRYIDEETAGAIAGGAPANSVSGGGIYGARGNPEEVVVSPAAAKRYKKNNKRGLPGGIRRRANPIMEAQDPVERHVSKYPMNAPLNTTGAWGKFLGSGALAATHRYITGIGGRKAIQFGSQGRPVRYPEYEPPRQTAASPQSSEPIDAEVVGPGLPTIPQRQLPSIQQQALPPAQPKLPAATVSPTTPQQEKTPEQSIQFGYSGGPRGRKKKFLDIPSQFKIGRKKKQTTFTVNPPKFNWNFSGTPTDSVSSLYSGPNVPALQSHDKEDIQAQRQERRRKKAEKRKKNEDLRNRGIDPRSGQASFGWD